MEQKKPEIDVLDTEAVEKKFPPAKHKLIGKTLAGLLVKHVWNEVIGKDGEHDNTPRILVHPKDADRSKTHIEMTFDTPEQAARIETLIHIQGLMGGAEGTKLFMTADIANLFLDMLTAAEKTIKDRREALLNAEVDTSKPN